MARHSDIKVRSSLASTKETPMAEPLAIPTCIVSFMSFIIFCIWLFIQVGFQLSYIY